ncbi:MAG: TerD family protein [Planctomycetota bacterium]
MDTAEKVLLTRRLKVVVEQQGSNKSTIHVASFAKNVESIGFSFAPPVVERLITWSPEELLVFAKQLIPRLLKMVGGNVDYRPMYPNFPEQVMEASEAELYLNAIWHYYGDWIGERILPNYQKHPRGQIELPIKTRVIELAELGEAAVICKSLISSRTSLSQSDMKDVLALLKYFNAKGQLESVLPDEIAFKEIAAMVCGYLVKNVESSCELTSNYVKTPTDILRLAAQLSGGDVSLASDTKFVTFNRAARRNILQSLDRMPNPLEDMQRYREPWLRLGERLHPGDYHSRFPSAHHAFQKLRSKERIRSFNSVVEALLAGHEILAATDKLSHRPGELARRLDHLLRSVSESDGGRVIAVFEECVESVSTPVLLQVANHFRHRKSQPESESLVANARGLSQSKFEEAIGKLVRPFQRSRPNVAGMRTVLPKGQVGKLMRIPPVAGRIDPQLLRAVVKVCETALENRFSALEPLGKCFIDPRMKNFMVPMSQRSASKALQTVARGSRLPLPDAHVVRFFLWWKEGEIGDQTTGRVDIDLSATIFDTNWNYLEHVSYTNLRSTKFGCVHSGDITSAPNGACEFIDIDLRKISLAGGRYVLPSVLSFTPHPFCNLPECFAGWMARKEPQRGEVFEPANVQNKVDLASDRRIAVPALIDLVQSQVIWADLALRAQPNTRVNIESNERGLVHYGAAIADLKVPNLFDLFSLHARGRGEIVDSKSGADTVFSTDSGITPFDIDAIVSQFVV